MSARRYVGTLLDLNPATLRNWVEDAERAEGTRPASPREAKFEGIRALKKRVAEHERANEILKTSAAVLGQADSTADSSDHRLPGLRSGPVRRRADLRGAK